MYEFKYCFQLSKKRMFDVYYYTLGSNDSPYFATSAAEFNQPKTDYSRCGQCQADTCTGAARDFWEKWDYLHCKKIPNERVFREIIEDIEHLKEVYNYIEKTLPEGETHISDIPFWEIRELSKQEPKRR